MKRLSLFALLLLAPPTSIAAQTAQPAQTAANAFSQDLQNKATQLAQVKHNAATVVGGGEADTAFLSLFKKTASISSIYQDLERKYPNITNEIAKEALALTNQSLQRELPELQRRQAAAYMQYLSVADIDVMIAFYGSPAGQRYLEALQNNNTGDFSTQEVTASGNASISDTTTFKDIDATRNKTIEALSLDDKRALYAFGRTSAALKEYKFQRQSQKITLSWMDEATENVALELKAATLKIIEKHEKAGTTK